MYKAWCWVFQWCIHMYINDTRLYHVTHHTTRLYQPCSISRGSAGGSTHWAALTLLCCSYTWDNTLDKWGKNDPIVNTPVTFGCLRCNDDLELCWWEWVWKIPGNFSLRSWRAMFPPWAKPPMKMWSNFDSTSQSKWSSWFKTIEDTTHWGDLKKYICEYTKKTNNLLFGQINRFSILLLWIVQSKFLPIWRDSKPLPKSKCLWIVTIRCASDLSCGGDDMNSKYPAHFTERFISKTLKWDGREERWDVGAWATGVVKKHKTNTLIAAHHSHQISALSLMSVMSDEMRWKSEKEKAPDDFCWKMYRNSRKCDLNYVFFDHCHFSLVIEFSLLAICALFCRLLWLCFIALTCLTTCIMSSHLTSHLIHYYRIICNKKAAGDRNQLNTMSLIVEVVVCWLVGIVLSLNVVFFLLDKILNKKITRRPAESIIVITGCDSGFGEMTSRAMTKMGYKVISACLSEDGVKRLEGVVRQFFVSFVWCCYALCTECIVALPLCVLFVTSPLHLFMSVYWHHLMLIILIKLTTPHMLLGGSVHQVWRNKGGGCWGTGRHHCRILCF